MNFPYKYTNGNVQVTLEKDGTKIREWKDGETPQTIFPEQADIKITNYCDLGDVFDPKTGKLKRRSKTCPFCHEASNNIGKHADLKKLWPFIKQIGPGRELACGGGAPLKHPDFEWFAEKCESEGIVLNVTNNILHMRRDADQIRQLQNKGRIWGLGISYRGAKSLKLLPENITYQNVCFHLILGIDTDKDIKAIVNWCKKRNITPRILLLGYKNFRNGVNFFNEEIAQTLKNWEASGIVGVLKSFRGILSFDNLALNQLNLKTKLKPETWTETFQGEDGEFSFFIDAVVETVARSSISEERIPIKNKKMHEVFNCVRKK